MSPEGDQFQFFKELATKLITVTEATEVEVHGESLSTRQIQRLIRAKKMAGIQMGRHYYTSRQAVRDYLHLDRRTGPKTE